MIYIFFPTIAPFPFTSHPIDSIISHHDILQLNGSVMLTSARPEQATSAEIAERSLRQAIEQDAFRLRHRLLTKTELYQMLGVSQSSPGEAML